MTGWMVFGLFLSVLIAIGGWTDWKRRYPRRGVADGPPPVRREPARQPYEQGGYDIDRS
ncbi:MAG TPA: hypothetical protein VGD67_23595 [Pseudonocardiaceae bacterium]